MYTSTSLKHTSQKRKGISTTAIDFVRSLQSDTKNKCMMMMIPDEERAS